MSIARMLTSFAVFTLLVRLPPFHTASRLCCAVYGTMAIKSGLKAANLSSAYSRSIRLRRRA